MAGEWVYSQVDLHALYGGVVPDLASREHLERFAPLLEAVTERLDGARVESIAVTRGPGLAGCLAVGLGLARALSLAWGVPVAGVNHLRAHAWSPFIPLHAEQAGGFRERLEALLPHLGLIVSGGNTLLFSLSMEEPGGIPVPHIEVLGQTRDDAAGEALDKGAKLLGMPYPGGPHVEQAAARGAPGHFTFPKTRLDEAGDFSFSGLKTSLRYRVEKMSDAELAQGLDDLCAGYQEAVIGQLADGCARVLEERARPWKSLGLSGGVANNAALRARLTQLAHDHELAFLPAMREHTGDNAAMIAFAAWCEPAAVVCAETGSLTFEPDITLEK